MRLVMFLALVMATPVLADSPKAPPKPTDQEQLIGLWVLTSIETDVGQASGAQLNRIKLAMTGRTCLITTDQPVSSTYTIDPTRPVKTIDMFALDGPNKSTFTRCIYELNADTLRLCQGQVGAERPAAFPAKPTPGLFVSVFKRVVP